MAIMSQKKVASSCFICRQNGARMCGGHCGLCPEFDDDESSNTPEQSCHSAKTKPEMSSKR
jgi:hypothetical protein